MKALILNSGLGSRMGDITKSVPKCMSIVKDNETILSNQIRLLKKSGIDDIVITTGSLENVLKNYLNETFPGERFTYVYNDKYMDTNYIYSIFLAKDIVDDDIIFMHGDLYFTSEVFDKLIEAKNSCVVIDKNAALPEKDFKAVVVDNKVKKIGIEFFEDAYTCQPLYKLKRDDWHIWLNKISEFCKNGKTKVYAENALNEITDKINLYPLDIQSMLCNEIDNLEDLKIIREKIN